MAPAIFVHDWSGCRPAAFSNARWRLEWQERRGEADGTLASIERIAIRKLERIIIHSGLGDLGN